jgi:NinB protein
MAETVRLIGPSQRAYAHKLIDELGDGYVAKFAKETRNDRQNRKLHAMIADIQRDVPDMATYSVKDAKLRFMNALGKEMRFLPDLENEGFFPVGHSTAELTVEQFNGLITLLYAYGDARGVRWREPQVSC